MNNLHRMAVTAVCLFLYFHSLSAQVSAKVDYAWEPFALSDVTLGDGCFRQAMDHHAEYVLSLDVDRLIPHVRKRSGLTPKGKNYGGWETNGGVTHGHYMTSCALYYNATGDTRFRERLDYMVDELRQCHEAADGGWWLSAGLKKSLEQLNRGELTLNRPDEAGQPWNVNNMGNAWYGVHKVLAGLRDAWLYAGNDNARQLLIETADMIVPYILEANNDLFQAMLSVEQGGMAEVMTDIYVISGDERFLRTAEKFNHKNVVYPIANGDDVLRWRHANDQIPKFVGVSREYVYTKNPLYLQAAKNFWEIVTKHHTTVIGGNSCYERFGKADSESFLLDYPSAETCNTYNMLKLSRNLFMLTGEKKYADYCEWALYNHILASLDPCHMGSITYYTNMQPGGMKQYSTAYDSFWCCVGSGMENHAKYAENVFYHNNDGTLLVNMFIPATLMWKEKGMKVRVETTFPESDKVSIYVEDKGHFSGNIALRNPQWCKGDVSVRHNGKKVTYNADDEYINIGGISKGDVIEITLPMTLNIRWANDGNHLGSFTYGPLVLAGVLADVTDGSDIVGGSLDKKTDVPVADIPQFKGNLSKPASMVRHEKNALAFSAKDIKGNSIALLPYYKVHHKRYSLYWNIYSEQEYKEKQRSLSDHIVVGNSDSETAHAFKSAADTTGWYDVGWAKNKQYRRAKKGGWFEYKLKINANNATKPYKLICRLWGDEPEKPSATVYVDNMKVGQLYLEERQHLTYVDLVFDIPLDMTRGKREVSVRFEADEGHRSPALFDVKMTTNTEYK